MVLLATLVNHSFYINEFGVVLKFGQHVLDVGQ